VKTSFGGFPPKEACLLLDPTTVSWFALMLSFLLEVCLAD
jgi:hypothetical protein